MVAGLYYDLQVDYSTQLWKEFLKSIKNTNALHGISSARYWSLILQYFYENEGILVLADEEKVVFHVYSYPKDATDDTEGFPIIARIPDAMLKRVDPTNTVLITFLHTLDTSVETGVLLAREEEKKTNRLRRIKMKSKHKSRSPLTNVVRNPQVSHQGVIFCEILALASPSSKKRRETDMAKHIAKKKRKSRVIISSESNADENETIPETPEADLQKDYSHIASTIVIPPEVLVAKTVSVEA
ncbi:unnamed protein product [Lactuca saligna]|uniref:Uncharacterized protein n=1 Tax=Lactuca saligna TaxID=75948 RepID=A0AA36E440_LACSI|nr:unnamed protein product [Lactuca saligna]